MPYREVFPNKGDDGTATEGSDLFTKMTGEKAEDNLGTANLAIWMQSMQTFVFKQVGEELTNKANLSCLILAVTKKKIFRPTTGDIC